MNVVDACDWRPLLGSQGRHFALHGTKHRWLDDTVEHGLYRPSAAWFELGADQEADACRRIVDTLGLAVELGLGRSLLDDSGKLSLADAEAPALVVFNAPWPPSADRRYRVPPSDQLSAPYAKVERAGHGVSPRDLVAVATITANNMDAATRTPIPQCPAHPPVFPARTDHSLEIRNRAPLDANSWNALRAIGVLLGARLVATMATRTRKSR